MVSIVVLAAGAANRMGEPKQLLPLGEKPMVWWTVTQACRSQAAEVLVVTGAFSEQVESALKGLPVKTVYNPFWAVGQAESVKAGLKAVKEDTAAVMFLPADQPMITADLLNQLIAAYNKGQGSIIVPICSGRRGAPVLFAIKWRDVISGIEGDHGAKKLLDQFPEEVQYVSVSDSSLLMDADSPAEYQIMRHIWEVRKDGTS